MQVFAKASDIFDENRSSHLKYMVIVFTNDVFEILIWSYLKNFNDSLALNRILNNV